MISEEKVELFKSKIVECDLTYIKAIVLVGSACLPCIDNPRDFDIYAYVSNKWEGEIVEAIQELRHALKDALPEESVAVRAMAENKWIDGCEFLKDAGPHNPCFLSPYAYQLHTQIVLYGDTTNISDWIDILGKHKQSYLKNLKHLMEYHFTATPKRAHSKYLYHVLTGLYMIENNGYFLTEEQGRNVKIAHDHVDLEKYDELFAWAKEELNIINQRGSPRFYFRPNIPAFVILIKKNYAYFNFN